VGQENVILSGRGAHPQLEAIDVAQMSSIGRHRNCNGRNGCRGICHWRIGRSPPEQTEWVFTLWFLAFITLITWAPGLILRPLVQSFLGSTFDRRQQLPPVLAASVAATVLPPAAFARRSAPEDLSLAMQVHMP
jgi:hypothetical protein